MIGRNISYVYPDDQQKHLQSEVIQPLRAKGQHHAEVRMKRKNGGEFFAYLSLSLERDPEGRVVGMIGSSIDITQRLMAEKELRTSEKRFRRAIQDAPFPVMMHAEDGEVLMLSKSWTEISGYSIKEIPTVREWALKAFSRYADAALERIRLLFESDNRVKQGELSINTADGKTREWENHQLAPG